MASRSTQLIPIIKEVLLQEIGEANLDPLNWRSITPLQYRFEVDVNGNLREVFVDFEQITSKVDRQYFFPPVYHHLTKIYNVAYRVEDTDNQFEKTSLQTLLKILSTVVDIVKHFMSTVDCEGLYIRGTERSPGAEDESKKNNLYKAFVKKQVKDIGGLGVTTFRDGFIVVRI